MIKVVQQCKLLSSYWMISTILFLHCRIIVFSIATFTCLKEYVIKLSEEFHIHVYTTFKENFVKCSMLSLNVRCSLDLYDKSWITYWLYQMPFSTIWKNAVNMSNDEKNGIISVFEFMIPLDDNMTITIIVHYWWRPLMHNIL